MKAAVVIPTDGEAYEVEVPEDPSEELQAIQGIVGGWIEIVPYGGECTVFCNEEGKIQGLPKNRRGNHIFGVENDYLVGNLVVLGPSDSTGDTTGLEPEEVETILEALNRISEKDMARWDKWDDLRARKAKATTDKERAMLALEEDALRDEGIQEMLDDDLARPESWWWISFADPDKPKGSQSLGVVIVKGGGMQEALQNAWTMNINPGGQVQAIEIPDEHVPPAEFHNRLLSRAELEEAGLA